MQLYSFLAHGCTRSSRTAAELVPRTHCSTRSSRTAAVLVTRALQYSFRAQWHMLMVAMYFVTYYTTLCHDIRDYCVTP
jgi:hypothetical protein